MNIKQTLLENGIEIKDIGDYLATYCPFCNKVSSGHSIATFNIDPITGNGHCSACKENFEWQEISDKL